MSVADIQTESRAELRQRAIAASMQVDGWLTEKEAGVLFDLASVSSQPIVEIGSWQGRSTVALALGSMAGKGQPVYAIDNFVGPQNGVVPSYLKSGKTASAELLRQNLDSAGVNGIVKIIAKSSKEAVEEIPDCGVLFVDGAHDYDSVVFDLEAYLPKLHDGGVVMCHDCTEADMGVVKAVDEHIMGHLNNWRVRARIDSAIVATKKKTERQQVYLGFPGPNLCFGAAKGLMHASMGAHDVTIVNSGTGWDDFNRVWVEALNAAERGAATHFAMLHSDITPDAGWVDILLGEMEDLKADLVSAVAPIKDNRGLTTCGVGDAVNPWIPFRRFTMREIMAMPETWGIADTPYPDKVLLHNTGCWACDIRNPLFFKTDVTGCLEAFFDFRRRAYRGADLKWTTACESEDWYFSRKIHLLGMRSFVTRKVHLTHKGTSEFPNYEAWGTYHNGDEDTRARWDTDCRENAT